MSWFLSKKERKSLWKAVKLTNIRKGRFALAVLLGVLTLGSSLGLAATSAWLIARASQMPPVLTLSVAVTSVRMFGISKALFRYLERLASHDVAMKGMADLRLNVYKLLSSGRTEAIAGLRRGDLLARTGADVDAVGDMLIKAVLPAVVTFITGVGTVLGLGLVNVQAAAVLAFCLILSGVIGPLVTMRSARLAELARQEAFTEVMANAMTVVDSAPELIVSGRINQVSEHLNQAERRLIKSHDKAALPSAFALALDNIALGLSVLGAIYFGVIATNNGQLGPVMLAVLVLTPLAAFEGTAMLAPAAVQLVHSAGAAVRIVDLLERAPREENSAEKPQVNAKEAQLVAQDLAVAWPGGPTVASGLNLSLQVGKTIAVVGPSGIGKSTLLFTLAGMLPPRSGSVKIAGTDISQLSREDASAFVSLTAEDAHVFEASVIENLRVANPHVDEDMAHGLLRQAGLEQWLAELPKGLETILGSGGTTVSGGERRRLLLARALAAPAPLMLLDEPGEHLDGPTADKLVTDLIKTTQDGTRAVLLVTHRLSALENADEVIVLAKDENEVTTIKARGKHRELMENYEFYRWAQSQEQFDE